VRIRVWGPREGDLASGAQILSGPALEDPRPCSLEASLTPEAISLTDAGDIDLVGSFTGDSATLGVASDGGTDQFHVLLVREPDCQIDGGQRRGTPADDEALGVASSSGGAGIVGRQNGTDGYVVVNGQPSPGILSGGQQDWLRGIAALDDGWVVVGSAMAGSTYDNEPVESLGGSDVVVLRLDASLGLLWQMSLGGPGDDDGLAVKIDPQSGEIVVLGTTTGPSELDRFGVLADGQRAIFAHRIPAP